jgi:hypothetical protein
MMIAKEHELTKEDYEIAESRGIDKKTLYARFYVHYWNKDEAMTRPVRRHAKSPWRAKCKELGIVDVLTYDNRLRYGWDEEKAATTPPMSREEIAKQNRDRQRKYPSWVYDELDKNGINHRTFASRVTKQGWTMEEACTLPVGTHLVDYYRNRVKELESQLG